MENLPALLWVSFITPPLTSHRWDCCCVPCAKPQRLLKLFISCSHSPEVFLICIFIYNVQLIIIERHYKYMCVYISVAPSLSNVHVPSVRTLTHRHSVWRRLRLRCRPTNRNSTNSRSCSKSCRSRRDSYWVRHKDLHCLDGLFCYYIFRMSSRFQPLFQP